MIIDSEVNKVLQVLKSVEAVYEELIFKQIGEVEMSFIETKETFRTPPQNGYKPIEKGVKWEIGRAHV